MNSQIRNLLFVAFGNLIAGIAGSIGASEVTGRLHRDDGRTFTVSNFAIIFTVVISIVGIVLAIIGAKGIIGFRTRRLRKIVNPVPRDVLVILLSNLRLDKANEQAIAEKVRDPRPADYDWSRSLVRQVAPKFDEGELGLTDLAADLQALANAKKTFGRPKWSWEQPLRAIHHGLSGSPKLRKLVVVCSQDSVKQAGLFAQLLIQYQVDVEVSFLLRQAGDEPILQSVSRCTDIFHFSEKHGWDFDDFDLLYQGLRGMLQQLTRTNVNGHSVTDRDIAIDWTGGTKPASVVAALVTVDRPIVNQYVTTEPKDPRADEWTYEILGYDLTHE